MSLIQKWAHNFTYDLALWIFNLMLDIFFREVRPRGAHRVPKEGAVIFVVAPHANQFVDPLILMRECGRRSSMIIAEKSMHQKAIGTFAKMIHAIPVVRAQDLAYPGKGKIQLLNRKSEPLRIIGIDTQFTTQLRPRDSITLPKNAGRSEVVEIISDTELIIKKEFKELKALELLTANEGTIYKCMPHVEQDSVYRNVHEQLHKGQCVTIFPEGGSHDRAELLPLKAGVTLMALGAMAKFPGLDVKIVPVGLNYFHAHRFRSRAVIEFGNPITITEDLVEKFKLGSDAKREACGKLLDTIYGALKAVTVNAGSYETLMLIQAARRLYKPAYRKMHISQVVDLNRRFLIGYNLFKDDPKVIDLQQRVLAYNQMIKYHGIKDHQVSKTDLGGRRTVALLMERIFILTLLTLWAFPGAILNLPVVIVAKIISQKKAIAAVKGSTVKIAGRDILATWKILVGLVLLPTLYAFYSFIMLIAVLQTSWDYQWKLLLPLATWVLLPFVSYASLRFGEIGLDILMSLQPLVMSILDPDGAEILRKNREKLSHDITELINEYGPKVFPDFDADYISRTTASTPSTSSTTRSSSNKRPAPVRRTSSSSFINWTTTTPSKLPKIASGFFQQAVRMGLDDKNIFNWGRIEESSDMDDNSFYLDRFNGGLTPTMSRSRRGSASESDSSSRPRSRTSSFGASANMDGFRIEAMTTIGETVTTSSPTTITSTTEEGGLKQRPLFKIEDYDQIPTTTEDHLQEFNHNNTSKKRVEDEGYAGDRDEDEQPIEFNKKH
ncbi:hypothetical protein BDA99DRAFT_497485 [Phascolomyces articulosus]|uniref:Phospholipid/glycerol acyltransferase domain-containing protein n=1 Tax=Phascolomyces articulosus TaxID=60185 RepID=A0AAD5K8B9_9FUNG|nr:hypothetical protein BDA99DRAFT_497485 [Phascolomyces articulosus]